MCIKITNNDDIIDRDIINYTIQSWLINKNN